ncbi:MAG: YtxH domain-containing protein [Candidatus Sulfotelmatobacter sp.]
MKFLLGFGIGIGLGMVFAPASGAETRRKLREKIAELARMPEEKMQAAADAVEEKAGDLGSRVGRQAAEAAVESVRNDILGDKSA